MKENSAQTFLNNYFLKNVTWAIAKILSEFLQKGFDIAFFPDCLEVAKLIPVYKEEN